MYERTRANQKEDRGSTFMFTPVSHFIHWPYFIYALKIYVCTRVKITRQWKSTLNRKKAVPQLSTLSTTNFTGWKSSCRYPLPTKMHLHTDVSYFFYFAIRGRGGNGRRLLGVRVFLRINKNRLCRNNWIMSFLTSRILLRFVTLLS